MRHVAAVYVNRSSQPGRDAWAYGQLVRLGYNPVVRSEGVEPTDGTPRAKRMAIRTAMATAARTAAGLHTRALVTQDDIELPAPGWAGEPLVVLGHRRSRMHICPWAWIADAEWHQLIADWWEAAPNERACTVWAPLVNNDGLVLNVAAHPGRLP